MFPRVAPHFLSNAVFILLAAFTFTGCGGATTPMPMASNDNEEVIELGLALATATAVSGGSNNLCVTGSSGFTTVRSKSTYTLTAAPVNCVLNTANFSNFNPSAGTITLNGNPSIKYTFTLSQSGSGTATGPIGGFTQMLSYYFGLIVSCSFPAPGTPPMTITFSNFGQQGSLSGGQFVCDDELYSSPPLKWP